MDKVITLSIVLKLYLVNYSELLFYSELLEEVNIYFFKKGQIT